jgi:hypothetical protein
MNEHRKTSGFALRIFCATLLVLLGFAHRPVMAAPVADLTIYVLPDGSVASLCIPGENGKPEKHVDHGCEACRIGSNIVLPTPSSDLEAIGTDIAEVDFLVAPERFHRLNFPPNAPPRGPPVLPVSFITV